jgi:Ca2+-binding EF-hand superfamily protein
VFIFFLLLTLSDRDKSLIGKGDLLATAIIPFGSLTQSKVPVNDEWQLQYASGAATTLELCPSVSVQYIFWTRDWKNQADKKSVALLKAAEQLVMSNADSVDVPLEKVRSVAQKFVEVARGNSTITEKSQLLVLAQATGLTATFSLFDASHKMAESGPGRLSIRSGGSAFVDYLWDVLDTNNDGQIDFQELLMGIAMHTAASPSERAEFYFDIFDTDKSGSLSRDEVVKLWQKNLQVMMSSFKHDSLARLRQDPELNAEDQVDWTIADKVFDNVIQDFNKLNLALQLTDAVFSHVDKDGSGTISKSEYMEFFSNEGVRSSLSAMAQRALDAASSQIDAAARRRLLRNSVAIRM